MKKALLQEQTKLLREAVLRKIESIPELEAAQLKQITADILAGENRFCRVTVENKRILCQRICDSILGLDVLEELLRTQEITEVMVNGDKQIFIEKKGRITQYDGTFSSAERLEQVIQQIVSRINRRVNESSPIADARLPDGSRVHIVLPPISLDGPIVTIRRFPQKHIVMEDLIDYHSITKEVADGLKILVKAKYNIFISGGTGSGKTTFLNVLSDYIPQEERVITIEDSAELQLKHIKNLVRLEARAPNTEGENAVSIRELIKAALRMRPDRIIVGEIRGEEALDMLQAMNTGHDGSLSTGHSNSPRDMLGRLETMVLTGIEMPMRAVRGQIVSGINLLVHLGRVRDKSRKVLEITELVGLEDGEFVLNPLFEFRETSDSGQTVKGNLCRTENRLIRREKLAQSGLEKELGAVWNEI